MILLLAFVVVPIVELYVIVQVGQAIGVLQTIALVILMSMAGAWLMKREGLKAWNAFVRATQERRVPAKEVADGALVLFGGALLLTPGFVSDIAGLVLILPPTRALFRRSLTGFVANRFVAVRVGQQVHAQYQRRATRGTTIEGETVERPYSGPDDEGRAPE
jgi:UPF0716 protein FxsA